MTTKLEKPVRRVLDVAGVPYVLEFSRAGVMFRRPGRRARVVAPWRLVLRLAERLAGEELHREQLRAAALRRAGRALVLAIAFACEPLHAPPAKRCAARDTIRLDSLPDTLHVARGCP